MIRPHYVERFSVNQRIQHFITLGAMLVLSVTGLALRYHDTWLGRAMISLEGGFETRGLIHRWAALILIALAFYHLFYLLFSNRGHSDLKKMALSRLDFKNIAAMLRLSRSTGMNDRIATGKFNIRQKVQYFGVVFGTLVMIATGLLLWFETQAMALMPKWMVDVTAIVHGAEGLLIFVILFLWHLYNVHLNPDAFPMSRTWITGRMSVEDLKTQHPEEYKSIFGDEARGSGD